MWILGCGGCWGGRSAAVGVSGVAGGGGWRWEQPAAVETGIGEVYR